MTLFGAVQAVVCEAARVEAVGAVARGAVSRALRQGPEALESLSEIKGSAVQWMACRIRR